MIDTSALLSPIIPQPEMSRDWTDWANKLTKNLMSQQGLYGMVDVTRQVVTSLQDEYIAADSFLQSSFEDAISVVATDVSAVVTRVTTLEGQVQIAGTGLLARVTTTEASIVTLTTATATLNTTVLAHTTSITTLQGDVGSLQITVTSHTASISSNATAITTANSAIASLNTTVSAHSTSISTNTSNISSTSATVSVIQTALAGGSGSLALLAFQVNTGTNAATLKLVSTSGGTWNGSAISLTATEITLNGNVIVNGTLTAAKLSITELSSIATDLGDITAGSIRLTAGGKVLHVDAGFGVSSDLVLWFGLSSIAAVDATKANSAWAFGTDGKVYYGGVELSGSGVAIGMYVYGGVNYDLIPNGDLPEFVDETITVTVSGGTGPYNFYYYDVTNTGGYTLTYTDGLGNDTFEASKNITTPGSYNCGFYVRVEDAAGAVAFGFGGIIRDAASP